MVSLNDFKSLLRKGEPYSLAKEYLFAKSVHALPTDVSYNDFREKVKRLIPSSEFVSIVGSGNWRFSLNPKKGLSEYHSKSDVDVAVVSNRMYYETWDEMRNLHRRQWYTFTHEVRQQLLRNGENIYSGFASPAWLPSKGHRSVYQFKSVLNQLSGPEIGYREVKMMFFKNETEMIDYYKRGFTEAKRELRT